MRCSKPFKGPFGLATPMAFSPDGKMIALALCSGNIKLWDIWSGNELQTFNANRIWVTTIVFSSYGKTRAPASCDGTVRLWDASSDTVLQTLYGHLNSVSAIALSPDGKMLVSASYDHTVRLWDANLGTLLWTVESDKYSKTISFFNNGADDGTILLTSREYHYSSNFTRAALLFLDWILSSACYLYQGAMEMSRYGKNPLAYFRISTTQSCCLRKRVWFWLPFRTSGVHGLRL